MFAIAWTDGGNRGSPGPAACAVVMKIGEKTISEVQGIGLGTNNDAEYQGVLMALRIAKENGVRHLEINSDAQLIVNQINGDWDCKKDHLKVYLREVRWRIKEFDLFSISWIPRELNKAPDGLVTVYLDDLTGKAR